MSHSLLYLAAIFLLSAGVWALLFYFQVLNQVRTAVDEGLSDTKIVIIDYLKDAVEIQERNEFLESNFIIRRVHEDFALQVLDRYSDTLVYSRLNESFVEARLLTTAFASHGQFYEMKVISHELDKGMLLRRIISTFLAFFLLVIFSTLLVNRWVLRNTWKPFYQLLDYLEAFRLDRHIAHEVGETRIKEFSMLNAAVQKLLTSNKEIYTRQKHFIENASHELQTPLAIAMSKLEMLAGNEGLSGDQIRRSGEIIETLRRLSGLNKSLLLLSKIENRQFSDGMRVDFDALFQRVLQDFEDYAGFKKLDIDYVVVQSWSFQMSLNLAEMLVVNLIKNAIVHNKPGGGIHIRLDRAGFVIENSGDGPGLDPEGVFRRFNGKSDNSQSTGLGLSIVKAIVDESGLDIRYSYPGRHCFTVKELK